jgi:hypothetical protein
MSGKQELSGCLAGPGPRGIIVKPAKGPCHQGAGIQQRAANLSFRHLPAARDTLTADIRDRLNG